MGGHYRGGLPVGGSVDPGWWVAEFGGVADDDVRTTNRATEIGNLSLVPRFRPASNIAVFSQRLARIPHLCTFLNAKRIVGSAQLTERLDAVAGWGHKPTAGRARTYARRHQLPYFAVEDGFLRSLDLGVSGAAPLSLVVDDMGIYYDSSRPSRLEWILNGDQPFMAAELAVAKAALAAIRQRRLSKYNAAPDPDPDLLPPTTRRRVLAVDQTQDDMSVLLGGGSAAAFRSMLEAALDENPGAEILVKPHPDTVAGAKRGYLAEMKMPDRVRLLAADINPIALLDRCEAVYTVTSQLGFEALLAGLPVSCHGMPFYAGWGATRDRIECPRRRARHSPLEIFAAAYLHYARYVDPVTGKACDIRRVVELLTEARRVNEANRGTTICLGMQRWKRRHVRPFLASTGGRTVFARSGDQALRKGAKPGDRILVWGDREPAGLLPLVSQLGARVGRVEDGFLRSVGLGSDFVKPMSLTIDWQGAYYDPTGPSDLETLLAETDFTPDLMARAATLRRRIVAARLSKYNVGAAPLQRPAAASGRRIVLVPGQVEDDASVRLGRSEIYRNLDLVEAVRSAMPDAFIAYKPHPDVVARNRNGGGGADRRKIAALCDAVWTAVNIHDCLEIADELHTLTSLAGFEALLRGKTVATYGGPFYAGWGLTRDRMSFPRRGRALPLDALVAGTLIVYPRYYDWGSHTVCDAEAIVGRLTAEAPSDGGVACAGPLTRPGRMLLRIARYVGGWAHA